MVRELFSLVTSAICVRIRGSQVRGYEDCLPHVSSFRPAAFLPQWIRRGISTLFCCINIKLIHFFVDYHRMLVRDCNLGCLKKKLKKCCFSFTMEPYQFHPRSKWWNVAGRRRRVRLCCQFYEHNNYLTSDAAKD